MDTISARCARMAAHAICWTALAIAGSGCEDTASEASESSSPIGAPVVEPAVTTPSAATGPAGGAGEPAAMDQPAEVAVTGAGAGVSTPAPAVPKESVDANGLRGTLVDMPFLSDMGDGKKSLILVDWEVPPNTEVYLCGRFTVPDDVYFNENHPINPLGTHHTAIGLLEKPNRPDGVTLCDVTEVGRRSVGGSGVGTTTGRMPAGIAMRAERGAQILLNLHLFNTSDAPLRGRSGGLVSTVAASQVTDLADGVTAGPNKLNVPPGKSTQLGACTVEYDYEIFAIFPHMHEMGRYMKVVAKRAVGDTVVLHEGGYDFNHQFGYRIDPPLQLAKGDRVELSCTYDNTSGEELHFGESSKDEMCIAGLARFPAAGRSTCQF
jgi:Copper type II ascorbate-dependent monooxygenase, C-terminal domain